MMRRTVCWAGGCAIACSLPSPALAHLVDMRLGDFHGAALHLTTGLQYVLLLVALSILAALHRPETGRWMLGPRRSAFCSARRWQWRSQACRCRG